MSTSDEPTAVEVCIVSFNSAAILGVTLDLLAANMPEASIAIREHGSDAAALERLRALAQSCRLDVRLETDASNPGFGSGCNALASGSRAAWLLFLNPDAEVVAWPWSAENRPPLRRIIGPAMTGEGESARQSGVTYRVRDEIRRSWLRRRNWPTPSGRGFVSGAALLIDRASFEQLGGFDEGYFMYYEDIDLCLRANDAGIDTAIERSWRVRHLGAHATRSRFAESLQWSFDSGCRFHGRDGSSVAGYCMYVVADSLLRAARLAIKRDTAGAGAYARLAGTALSRLRRR